MTAQASLFDVQRGDDYPPYRKHSRTSKSAARAIAPVLSRRRLQVLKAYAAVACGGADEVGASVGLGPLSVRPRVHELAERGYLTVTGARIPTGSGGEQEVYRITAKGREYMRQDGINGS